MVVVDGWIERRTDGWTEVLFRGRNETERNETERNETKRNGTERNGGDRKEEERVERPQPRIRYVYMYVCIRRSAARGRTRTRWRRERERERGRRAGRRLAAVLRLTTTGGALTQLNLRIRNVCRRAEIRRGERCWLADGCYLLLRCCGAK